MKSWWGKSLSALLLGSLVLTGCSQQTGSPAGGGSQAGSNEILIGAILPLTGNNATDGKDMKNAIEMATKKINDAGGINGKKLKIEYADDACDPQMAATAANKLVSLNVQAVVGCYCSGATLPASGVFKNANIPTIVTAANSSKLPAQGYDTLFLINGLVPDQAQKAAEYFGKQNAKNVAVVHDNSAYAKDLADSAKAAIEKSGGKVVAFEAINPEEKDFSALANKFKGVQPDGTYFTGYYAAGGLMAKQFKQKGVSGLFMVGDGSFSEDLIKIAGTESAEGLLVSATPTAEFIEGAQGFVDEYKKQFNLAPGPFSALTYNGMNLLADAVKRAGSPDKAGIKKALKETKNFQALGETITFNDKNTLDTSNFGILKVQSGKFTLAK